ncbi:VOC family protein [Methylobacter sp.]|uniref:VOC family protein n=1 Tax=Methylobacter sp. TaxID=2051955 RepID=UPI00121030DD|nr:VOC family protein [Methylobacter sp.]TAK63398.1 MAG: hypothetical protein EPO18_07275 [Methylobacter sp.]
MPNFNFNFHHASLIIDDTAASVLFYCDILGLQQTDRPDLGFSGVCNYSAQSTTSLSSRMPTWM